MTTTRVWRQLMGDIPIVETGAGQSIIRLAMAMWAADPQSAITDVQRRWVIQRLQVTEEGWTTFSAGEKARLKEPLLAYIAARYPGILAIVAKQFQETEEEKHR